jgi:hypothetical protein
LIAQPNLTAAEIAEMREASDLALAPAPATWVAKRIASLLDHYFVADMSPEQRDQIARDWMAAMTVNGPCPPAWAIANACTKYLASEHARRKPLPGDILALAQEEAGWAYALKSRLWYEDHPHMRHLHRDAMTLWPPKPVDPEMRKRLGEKLKELGLRLGGDARAA